MTEMTTLSGEGITLREHFPEDLEAVHRWHGDPVVMKFLSWGADSLEDSLLYLSDCIRDRRRSRRDRFRLAIELPDGCVAGCATIHWRGRGPDGGDGRLGCFLAREYQGRGIAREATRLLVDFGFKELGMHRISATCLEGNASSQRTLLGLGFVYEGTMRSHSNRGGHWLDRHFYSILKEEWGRSKQNQLINAID
jgi:RimJ/RimL family protein N-acetyltransferase